MAYPWEWQNKHRDSYDRKKDPGENKQNLAYHYSWSSWLSRKTSLPAINLAFTGNSNQNAINTVVRTIQKNNLTNSFIVLGLTQSIRHFIPSIYGVDRPLVIKVTGDHNKSTYAKKDITNKDISNYSQYWYKVNYDKAHELDNIKIQLLMLNEFVKSRDSKLLVIDNLFKMSKKFPLDAEIKNCEYLLSFNDKVGISWPHYIHTSDKDYHVENHPGTLDHSNFSDFLYNKYFLNKKQKSTQTLL